MSSSTDDFSALRSLLKLKQHEQPPSRYFDDLSHGVVKRLRGPEGLRQKSLFSLLDLDFGLKPALFYGLGAACCMLAFYGVTSLLLQKPSSIASEPQTAASLIKSPNGLTQAPQESMLTLDEPSETSVSTNPVLSSGEASFPMDGFKLRPTPVSYRPQ
jgi:hypothetical protein